MLDEKCWGGAKRRAIICYRDGQRRGARCGLSTLAVSGVWLSLLLSLLSKSWLMVVCVVCVWQMRETTRRMGGR